MKKCFTTSRQGLSFQRRMSHAPYRTLQCVWLQIQGHEFESQQGHIIVVEIDCEIFSLATLPALLMTLIGGRKTSEQQRLSDRKNGLIAIQIICQMRKDCAMRASKILPLWNEEHTSRNMIISLCYEIVFEYWLFKTSLISALVRPSIATAAQAVWIAWLKWTANKSEAVWAIVSESSEYDKKVTVLSKGNNFASEMNDYLLYWHRAIISDLML